MYLPPFEVEPTKTVAGCISLWEGIWKNPEEDIAKLEAEANKPDSIVKFEKAVTRGEQLGLPDIKQRTNYNISLSGYAKSNEVCRQLSNKYFEIVYSAATYYNKTIAKDVPTFFGEEFNLLRYQTGQEYTAHFDGLTESKRSISAIVYLNDTYTGGEVEFVNFDLKIKAKPGTLLLFPSNYAYTHIAHPVTDGTKYAIVTWLHDVPPVPQQ